jgi:hypothetical protein
MNLELKNKKNSFFANKVSLKNIRLKARTSIEEGLYRPID